MQYKFIQIFALAFLGLAVQRQASAHVEYSDITNIGNTGIFDTFTSFGWGQGQIQPGTVPTPPQGTLATTDDVNWYSFTLTQTSNIDLMISTSDLNGTPLVAPAFSLYSGLFVDQSFDVNPVIPLQADERGLVNTAQSFSLTTDSTTMSQAEANLRTIDFITGVTDGGTGTAMLMDYQLGPGSYTVIAGGNLPWMNSDNDNANYGAIVSFSYTPIAAVPLPATFWLMATSLVSLSFGRCRKIALAA